MAAGRPPSDADSPQSTEGEFPNRTPHGRGPSTRNSRDALGDEGYAFVQLLQTIPPRGDDHYTPMPDARMFCSNSRLRSAVSNVPGRQTDDDPQLRDLRHCRSPHALRGSKARNRRGASYRMLCSVSSLTPALRKSGAKTVTVLP